MRLKMLALATMATLAAPSGATTTVYLDYDSFQNAVLKSRYRRFSPPTNGSDYQPVIGGRYQAGIVTLSAAILSHYDDGMYFDPRGRGFTPYVGSARGHYDIASRSTALGLYLGSFYNTQTVTYSVDGVRGSLEVTYPSGTTFIGFTHDSGPLEIAFDHADELDVVAFATAFVSVPEPATWAMMIGGMGAVGAALRRRRARWHLGKV